MQSATKCLPVLLVVLLMSCEAPTGPVFPAAGAELESVTWEIQEVSLGSYSFAVDQHDGQTAWGWPITRWRPVTQFEGGRRVKVTVVGGIFLDCSAATSSCPFGGQQVGPFGIDWMLDSFFGIVPSPGLEIRLRQRRPDGTYTFPNHLSFRGAPDEVMEYEGVEYRLYRSGSGFVVLGGISGAELQVGLSGNPRGAQMSGGYSISIEPFPRLELDPSASTVSPGVTVTFHARSPGTFTQVRWNYTPDGGIREPLPCDDEPSCTFAPSVSGDVLVEAWIYETSFGLEWSRGRVDVVADEPELVCDPVEVVRAEEIQCVIEAPDMESLVVDTWRFEGLHPYSNRPFSVDEESSAASWGGPLLMNGAVEVSGTHSGAPFTVRSADLRVRPRPWLEPEPISRAPELCANDARCPSVVRPPRFYGDLGAAGIEPPDRFIDRLIAAARVGDRGPSRGLGYFDAPRNPVEVTGLTVFVNPDLYDPGSALYRDHENASRTGSGVCSIRELRENVIAHEYAHNQAFRETWLIHQHGLLLLEPHVHTAAQTDFAKVNARIADVLEEHRYEAHDVGHRRRYLYPDPPCVILLPMTSYDDLIVN
jgi:hypothetical protein